MSALTSLLARDQVVPVRKIEEALSRQVLEGGEIETVLLEMGLVQEDVLSAYLAALYGLLPATREEIMHAARNATRALPAALAQKLRVLPLSFDGKILVVAATEPPSESAQQQIAEAAKAKVSVRVVNEARLLAGLSHHYGLELEHRYSRLLDKLRRQSPGTITYVKPPAGGPIRPVPAGHPTDDAVQVETSGSVRPSQAPAAADGRAHGMPDNVTFAVAKACRGPLVEQRTREVLTECETREDVLYVLLRYASQFFEFSAIFSVQGESARGRASRGAGVSGEMIRSVDVPLTSPGLLFRAVRDKRALVGSLSQTDDERVATMVLGRPPGTPGVAVPIVLGTRVVLVLYVDRDGEALSSEDVEPFVKLMPALGEALRRIIVTSKALTGARSSLLPGTPSLVPQGVEVVGDPGPVETSAAGSRNNKNGASAFPPQVETRRMGSPTVEPTPPPESSSSQRGLNRPRATAEMDAVVAPAAVTPVGVPSEPPPPLAEPSYDDGAAPAPEPDWVPPMGAVTGAGSTLRGVPRAAPPPPTSDSGPPPAEQAPAAPEPVAREREEGSGEYSLHSQDGLRSERAGPASHRPPPGPKFSAPAIPRFSAASSVSASGRRPARSEPSIVVEAGTQVSMLINDLMRTSPDEEAQEIDKLLQAGNAALPELAKVFPGPLWFDRHQPHRRRPSGRDVSAVARALVAFGERAAPTVAKLVREGSGDVCYFALMVAGQMPSGVLVEPVARRMFDPDPGIAQLSIDVLRGFVHLREFDMVLHALSQLAAEKERPLRQQFALRALAQLGDGRAAATLLAGFASPAPAVARVAHESLVLLTCQDFGRDEQAWERWLSEWGDAHRIEWLLEALVHEEERLRGLAGAELTRVTQQSFGYHPGLAPREREVAQRKYREWWEREGRGLFQAR